MITANYIVGLTDGEGSFTALLRPAEKSTWHNRVEPHYYIKLREEELPLLRKVKIFFGCGRISLQKDKRINHKDCYRYEVSNLRELKKVIIPFF